MQFKIFRQKQLRKWENSDDKNTNKKNKYFLF